MSVNVIYFVSLQRCSYSNFTLPMKLITLSGGLGNQMFQYALYLSLRARGEHVFLYKNKILKHREHSGYELQRIFGVESAVKGMWLTNLLQNRWIGSFVKHLLFPCKLRERKLYDYASYERSMKRKSFPGEHWVGYWQSEKYFAEVIDEVRRSFTFNESLLSQATKTCVENMPETTPVSLHVRRGDYVSTSFSWMYGDLCNLAYYRKAIQYIKAHVDNPVFYVFSDDLEWVKENLPLSENSVLVDWNRGIDSWQDLYLMSQCKAHVLANSSFSWWGTWLDANPNKVVVTPAVWVNHIEAPDVVPDSWVRL